MKKIALYFLVVASLFVFFVSGSNSSEKQVKKSKPLSMEAPPSLFKTQVVFQDSFKKKHHKWPEIKNKKAYTKISSGKYTIQHKRKTGAWMETIPVEFEQWEDFTIESTITKSSGVSNHGYGLIWGGKDAKSYYTFSVSSNGQYRFGKFSNGKWKDLIKWKKSKHIKTGNSKNKFTIKKKGLTYEFLMNDKKVDTYTVQKFFGPKIGFLVNLKMKIKVHDITVTGKLTIPQIYNIIKAGAEKGNPYHQALLGDAYRKGYPFKEDDPKGEKLIKLSAEKGHPFGLYELGDLYRDGDDFKHDKEKSEALYKKAFTGMESMAKAGDAFAQTYLGDIYYNGYGVGKDFKQAKVWFEKAATQGQFRSRMMVGLLYGKGEGVKKDYKKAMAYFLNEGRKGYYVAQYDVGVFYDYGWGVKKDMKAAKKWYERAIAVNDYHMALNNLARFYQWGYGGTKIDKAKARKLFKRAAEGGNDKATVNYAAMVKGGEGGKKDEKEAFKWYHKGALKGDASGQNQVAYYYRFGGPIGENKAKAMKYNYFSAEKGDKLGKKWLAEYDMKDGLHFPVRITWGGDKLPKDNLEQGEMIHRTEEGYKAEMIDISHGLFKKAVALDAEMLYKDNVWYTFYINKLPMSLFSELLLSLKGKFQGKPDFWFFYAHGALIAGQPALSLPAIEKMEALISLNPNDKIAKMLKPISGLMKAAAMVQMGKMEAAYKMLFTAGKVGGSDAALINYINIWLKPLLKDKKKFAFVTGIEASKLIGTYQSYQPQAFHHPISGKLIKPVKTAPKLKKKPRPTEKPVQPVAPKKPAEKGAVILQ